MTENGVHLMWRSLCSDTILSISDVTLISSMWHLLSTMIWPHYSLATRSRIVQPSGDRRHYKYYDILFSALSQPCELCTFPVLRPVTALYTISSYLYSSPYSLSPPEFPLRFQTIFLNYFTQTQPQPHRYRPSKILVESTLHIDHIASSTGTTWSKCDKSSCIYNTVPFLIANIFILFEYWSTGSNDEAQGLGLPRPLTRHLQGSRRRRLLDHLAVCLQSLSLSLLNPSMTSCLEHCPSNHRRRTSLRHRPWPLNRLTQLQSMNWSWLIATRWGSRSTRWRHSRATMSWLSTALVTCGPTQQQRTCLIWWTLRSWVCDEW